MRMAIISSTLTKRGNDRRAARARKQALRTTLLGFGFAALSVVALAGAAGLGLALAASASMIGA